VYFALNFTQMKQLLFTFCIVILALSFSSCEKEYICTCVTTDTSGKNGPSELKTTLPSSKKSDAEEVCAGSGGTIDTLETVCSLD